jgi:hypothetical protein
MLHATPASSEAAHIDAASDLSKALRLATVNTSQAANFNIDISYALISRVNMHPKISMICRLRAAKQ